MNINVDLMNPADKKMLGKLRRGSPVQIKPIHFDEKYGKPVKVSMDGETLKKMMKAKMAGRGVRICLSPEEAEMMSGEGLVFTKTGRVQSGSVKPVYGGKVKSIKQLNRETSKAFKKAGKDIKKAFTEDVPEITKKAVKGYKEKVRPYASPVFKELITNVLPELAGKAVEEGLKSQGVSPAGAKVSGKLVKAGLKKPSKMAYEKSGLGLYAGRGAPIPVSTTGAGMRKIHRIETPTHLKTAVEVPATVGRGAGMLYSDKLIDPLDKAYQPNTIAEQWTPVQLGRGLY